MKNMKKLLVLLIVSLMFSLSSVPAMAYEKPVAYNNTITVAYEKPVIFKDTITVTADGGRYQVGFVNIEFKKDFLDPSMLPATFDVEIYAENGVAYIEFSPSTPVFNKPVHLRIDNYNGLLYDKATNKNIEVNIKKHQVLAPHFSRFSLER